jgi:hypothetical protein
VQVLYTVMLVLLSRDSFGSTTNRKPAMAKYVYVTFFEYTAMLACRNNVKCEKKQKRPGINNLQYVSALGGRYWKMELNLFSTPLVEGIENFVQYVLTTHKEPNIATFHPTCLVSTPDRPWLATFVPGYLSYQSSNTTNVVCVFVAATKYTQKMSVSDIAEDQFAYIQFVMLASGTHKCFLVWHNKHNTQNSLTHIVIQRDCLVSEAILEFVQQNRQLLR